MPHRKTSVPKYFQCAFPAFIIYLSMGNVLGPAISSLFWHAFAYIILRFVYEPTEFNSFGWRLKIYPIIYVNLRPYIVWFLYPVVFLVVANIRTVSQAEGISYERSTQSILFALSNCAHYSFGFISDSKV